MDFVGKNAIDFVGKNPSLGNAYTKVCTLKNNTNLNPIFCLVKSSKLILFFTCITPDYMGVDIDKEIWKNTHCKNMTAGFLQRCQNLLRRFTPEMIHFQAWKKEILNNNNVIDFDPTKI